MQAKQRDAAKWHGRKRSSSESVLNDERRRDFAEALGILRANLRPRASKEERPLRSKYSFSSYFTLILQAARKVRETLEGPKGLGQDLWRASSGTALSRCRIPRLAIRGGMLPYAQSEPRCHCTYEGDDQCVPRFPRQSTQRPLYRHHFHPGRLGAPKLMPYLDEAQTRLGAARDTFVRGLLWVNVHTFSYSS
jgi:hypothetical protein